MLNGNEAPDMFDEIMQQAVRSALIRTFGARGRQIANNKDALARFVRFYQAANHEFLQLTRASKEAAFHTGRAVNVGSR